MGYTVGFQAERTATSQENLEGLIPFSGEKFNIGGGYDASTSTFTAPAPGTYIMSFTLLSGNFDPHPRTEAQFYKNGADSGIGCYDSHGEGYMPCSSVMIAHLEKGDTMQVHVKESTTLYGDASKRGLTQFA